jgi:uncharacterized membrane protein YhaH (DUF805 family)
MNIKQPLSWQGEINRRDYFIWGFILFAVKYNLDRLTALAFGKSWYITDYYVHADGAFAAGSMPEEISTLYLTLLILSLPFIWFGTVLCVKRLKNAQLSPWLAVFFFIPFINFVLFLILAAIPAREHKPSARNEFIDKLIPTSKYGSALFAVGIVLVIALALTGLFIRYLLDYGWSLFVGIPFFLGFGSVLLYGHHRYLEYKESVGVAMLSVAFFGVLIFVLAFEGIVCIAMGAPIFFFVAWIGATLAHRIHGPRNAVAIHVFIIPVIFIPLAAMIEHRENRVPETLNVCTTIVIDAPRQAVWNELVAFSTIAAPKEWLFQTGIAYPIHAQIEGRGIGAIRKCNFTTGCFIEPITTWDEPARLAFGVIDQPPPMIEWSIYNNLEIPHLDGYFKSEKGQFRLEELPNGQTLLEGTTWYHHDIWPSSYWRLWSDYILHTIHWRVLTHIKQEAEKKP